MIDIRAEYQQMLADELDKLLEPGEEAGCTIAGPSYVPDNDDMMVAGWMAQVMLRDGSDFHASVPLAGILLNSEVLGVAAEHLLELLRAERGLAADGAGMAFSATCTGQVGDEFGNPVGPVKYPPGHSGAQE